MQSDKLTHILKERKRRDEIDKKDSSKRKLKQEVNRYITTSFIGALASVEKYFGKLWGQGKADEDCTEAENAWFDVWEQCRTEILNKGNNQVRMADSKVEEYGVSWEPKKREIPVSGR